MGGILSRIFGVFEGGKFTCPTQTMASDLHLTVCDISADSHIALSHLRV